MPMRDELGVAFAPTAENSLDANRRGQVDGVPQAIRVISLALPRVLGARGGISPLVGGQGAGGMDPFLSALMQTLARTARPGGSMSGGSMPPGAPPMPAPRNPNIIVKEPPAPEPEGPETPYRPPNPQLPGPRPRSEYRWQGQ